MDVGLSPDSIAFRQSVGWPCRSGLQAHAAHLHSEAQDPHRLPIAMAIRREINLVPGVLPPDPTVGAYARGYGAHILSEECEG